MSANFFLHTPVVNKTTQTNYNSELFSVIISSEERLIYSSYHKYTKDAPQDNSCTKFVLIIL
jgi:hypothetical protein